jgi:flagellar biosynthesis protein FlhG
MASTGHIIAVGGGKGGIGKSIIATNIAAGLALSGKKVVLVDTDFGSSNLHALLGIYNPAHGFANLFQTNAVKPQSLLLDTQVKNLQLICAAGDNPGSSDIDIETLNIVKNNIRNLKTDYVVLDLAPGVGYSVVDFFNLAHTGLAITTPELTSIIKTFSYIRAVLFRKIGDAFNGHKDLLRLVDHSNPTNADMETHSISLLKEKLLSIDPKQVLVVETIVDSFKPCLIVNRVRYEKDLKAGVHLIELVKKFLGVETVYLGYLIESDRVRDSVDETLPFLIKEPHSEPGNNIHNIIENLSNQAF